jgi:ubiquinone/menaquinone biosynthesis C-methylase UbiE
MDNQILMDNQFCSKFINYIESNQSYNQLVEFPVVIDLIGDLNGKYILDVGVGAGLYSGNFQQNGGTVYCTDLIKKLLKYCKKKDFDVFQNDAKHICFRDETFDLVLSTCTIGYFKDVSLFFREAHRVLKPEGIFILSDVHPIRSAVERKDSKVISSRIIDYFGQKTYDSTMKVKPFHFRRTIEELFDSITEAGFLIEKIKEPKPKDGVRIEKDSYNIHKNPCFIVFKARKQ